MTHYDVKPLDGFDPEVGLLLAAMQDSTREWRETLGEVSPEAIAWRAVPGSYNIGVLLLHIIDAEDHWLHTVAGGLPRDPSEVALFLSDELDQDEGRWPDPPAEPLSWFFDLHDRVRERAFASLVGIESARTFERPGRGYDCTLRWILSHVLEHDSYTGGQAVAIHEMWKKAHG